MQAGSVKMPSVSPVVPVGKAALVTAIMGMSIVVLPLMPAIMLPFLALPLAHVVARWGVKSGAIVSVLPAALIYVGAGAPLAVLVLLLTLGIGMTLGWAVRKGWTFERGFALTACGGLTALVAWGAMAWLAFGIDLTWLRETMDNSIDEAAAQYTQLGMGAGTVERVTDQLRHVVDVIPYVTPGLLGVAVILLAACSLGLAYLIFPRLREKVAVSMSFSGFRLHWATAYASIVGLALLLFARGDGSWRTVAMYVGINLLMVSQTLCFLQGLAVARWLAVNRHMGRGWRVVLYVAAVLGQMLFLLTGLVGLFDTWVDYRKRYALKSPGTGSVR
jgi:uncharacterized protein YybS (DUF2232 family)